MTSGASTRARPITSCRRSPPPSRERRERQARQAQRQRPDGKRRSVPPWAIIGVVLVVVVVVLVLVTHKSSKNDTSPKAAVTHHSHHKKKKKHKQHKVVKKAPPAPTSVTLSMVATGDVYVCLENGSGKVLIPGTIYNTGDPIPNETGKKLLLTLGNSAVKIKANGAAVPVSASSGAIGLRFTPGGHSTLAAAQEPTCT